MYTQKTNSHLFDLLDAPYEDNLNRREGKKSFTSHCSRKMSEGETRDLSQALKDPAH